MTKIISALLLSSSLFAGAITVSGSIISDNQKMITSRFMGFVTQVSVSEGDRVKKGQALYSIDSKEIDSAMSQVDLGISQAQLSLQMYQNQYQNVQLNLERHKRLLDKDMVSKYDVENLQLAAKNLEDMISIAKKQVNQAEARRKEVKNQYNYLNIKAPNNGVVISTNIKVGEMAMPGMPAIVLSDLSDLKVAVDIAEGDLQKFAYGKKVKVDIPSSGISVLGKVTAVIPNSNPMTHSFKIKVSFNPGHKVVYPGMYATVSAE
jgi:RND family efflux transporter MFP subunit